MIQIKTFTFNPFQENTYVLYDETNECVIIDAGCNDKNEQLELLTFIEEKELKVKYIINTHCHIDHILGNAFLVEKYAAPSIAHQADLPLLQRANDMAIAFGLSIQKPPMPDKWVNHHDLIRFGNTELQVLHIPGHSPGCIAFYGAKDGFVMVGDVLFKGSIGRTDLPGGDFDTIINSINQNLFTLPENTVIYSGHGDKTTIGYEKKNNPFFVNQ
ncbi:MAG: MBL fold metallo-hydrolase [Bacteroidales bacterium]